MRNAATFPFWFSPILVIVASFPNRSVDGSESQYLGDDPFESGLSVAQPVQGETPIEFTNPTNSMGFDKSESTLLHQQQDSLLVDNTSPVDGCVSEDLTTDRDIFDRKRAISLNSQNTGACSSGYNPLVPKPGTQKQPPQPVHQGPDSSGENPCLHYPKALEFPVQTKHVSCGSHPVGDDPIYPSFVLNCVPGKSDFIEKRTVYKESKHPPQYCCALHTDTALFYEAYNCYTLPNVGIRTPLNEFWTMSKYGKWIRRIENRI